MANMNANDAVVVTAAGAAGRMFGRIVALESGIVTIRSEEPEAGFGGFGADAAVTLEIPSARGLVRTDAIVRDHITRDLVVAEIVQRPALVQRREFVRVAATLPSLLEAIGEDGEPEEGTTIDLSGGGAMLRLRGGRAAAGDAVRVAFELPEEPPVVAIGRVSRSDRDMLSMAFDRIPPSDRERLIRFVFSRLRAVGKVA
jgi:PilZ domain